MNWEQVESGWKQIDGFCKGKLGQAPCPTCAAAPRERCCEIANGAFRQDAHFPRLLSAAGQGLSSRQHKPATDVLPDTYRR